MGTGAHVRVIGKGRKERCTPLSKNTRAVLAAWAREPSRAAKQPLFPNARGGTLELARRALPARQARCDGQRRLPVTEAASV